jgi:hypothetical protein
VDPEEKIEIEEEKELSAKRKSHSPNAKLLNEGS